MKCPFCREDRDRVVDSRPSLDDYGIRRRRECLACHRRFTTYERVEELDIRVVKKNGQRENFDRKKILAGLLKACEKRPIGIEILERSAEEIEGEILRYPDREIPTRVVGEMVMKRLKELDHVAYVRFASVYRDFKDPGEFRSIMKELESSPPRRRPRKS
ncbi:MAG: transcriptional regulator NrdR [Planctomycetota bacterium]